MKDNKCYVCGQYSYGDPNDRFNIEAVFRKESDAKEYCNKNQELYKITHDYYEAEYEPAQ